MSTQFLVKSHKFKASNVIISDLEETMNGKPVFRLKYKYPDGNVGPLKIQMGYKVVKMGVTGMLGETPTPVNEKTSDSISMSFSDGELFTDKERHFINEIEKMENRVKEAILPHAAQLINGADEFDDDPKMMAKFVNGKFNTSIKYSYETDPKTKKKTKTRDHKYTSLRLKMYKNEDKETGKLYYQGKYIPLGKNTAVQMDLKNYQDIIPKWSTIKPIVYINSVWIVPASGAGITWLPEKIKVESVSEGLKEAEFEEDSEPEDLPTVKRVESDPESGAGSGSEDGSADELDDLDNLQIQTPKPVVTPVPKKRVVKK